MKIIIITCLLATVIISSFAQSPQGFKYQVVVRDNTGEILVNQDVSFQISILQYSASGQIIYTETHNTTTNDFGFVNLKIGDGTVVAGDFTSIIWGNNNFFLQIEMDDTGGTNYNLLGTSQFLSVPHSINTTSLTLTSPGGANYEVIVDNNGNLITLFHFVNCGDIFQDSRDYQKYETVQIGTQCWMAENLNIGTQIVGTVDQMDNSIFEKYCYDNLESNCDTYGGMYKWGETMQYTMLEGTQGICPDGWHIPTDIEWKVLEGNVDNTYCVGSAVWNEDDWRGSDAGGNLKETGTTHWLSPNTGATNSSGFKGLPGGRSTAEGGFNYINKFAYLWSSSEADGTSTWIRHLGYGSSQASRVTGSKDLAFNLRCLKDFLNQSPTQPTNPLPENGSIDIGINDDLYWTCSDPEGYDLNYKVYFGTETDPPLLVDCLTEATYDPGFLNYNTTYYWKVTVFDSYGDSAVSDVWSFITKTFECGELISDIEGNIYNTVQIDAQCWMAENLNIGAMIDSLADPTNDGSIEKWCYRNSLDSCDKFGGLYNWNEMMEYVNVEGVQGICPVDWHIPTDEEWKILEGSADSLYPVCDLVWDNTSYRGYNAGKNLKSNFGWDSGGNGSDLYGFTGLPGGARDDNGTFSSLTIRGIWWSSTESIPNPTESWDHIFRYDGSSIDRSGRYDVNKNLGLSVRCLKDYINQPPDQPSNPSPEDGSIDIGADTVLSWTCSDPDGCDLIYKVYFGTEADPPLLIDSITEASYDPGILNYNTTYYWKVTAFDSFGDSAVSDVWSFITKTFDCGELISDIDGNTYNTIVIGTQCWMKENLKTTTYQNGISIPNVTGIAWLTLSTGAYVWYANDIIWKDLYGGLYNWYAAVDANGLCPTGWHVPSNDEWTALTNSIGGTGNGNKLKSCRQVNSPLGGACNTTVHPRWRESSENGTDDYEFSGLPGGYRSTDGMFWDAIGWSGSWWSSTEGAWYRHLYSSNGSVYVFSGNPRVGLSVRCLRD